MYIHKNMELVLHWLTTLEHGACPEMCRDTPLEKTWSAGFTYSFVTRSGTLFVSPSRCWDSVWLGPGQVLRVWPRSL